MTKETVSQEERSNGDERSIGRFDGRRAKHADSRDVRRRRYQPLTAPVRFVSASLTSRQAAFGGPSNGLALRDRGSKISVRLCSFVPPVKPFAPSPPSPRGAQHPTNQPCNDEQQQDDDDGAADHVSLPSVVR